MNKKHIIIVVISIALLSISFLFFYFYKNNLTLAFNFIKTNINENNNIPLSVLKNNSENSEITTNTGSFVVETVEIEEVTQETIVPKNPTMEFAILPLTISNNTKIFYESLKLEHDEFIDKIIIITPNSNELSNAFSSPKSSNYCFNNDCINVSSQADNIIPEIDDFRVNELGNHFKFLNDNFNNKEIGIIFVSKDDFENTEILKNYLKEKYENDATLFLTISDLSRIDNTDYKSLHNTKTFYTLNNSNDVNEYKNIEVSCPSCLYLSNSLALEKDKYPHKFRDIDDIIYYYNLKIENNGITITFFGDMIYDRGVSYYLDTKEKYSTFLKDLFENSDISLTPNEYKTRKLFGVDFAGANMETPVVAEKTECAYTEKEIAFCSKKEFLPWIKELGFNIFSLANNHSLDGGVSGHLATIKSLDEQEFNYAGYIRHGQYFEKNYISTGSVRGINYAWHSYDFTITKYLMDTYCKTLEEYKNNGYKNFVAVHWGAEYIKTHNATQEQYAKKLIDCGADLIIGHHPHVIQDIGDYSGVSIIYSLGNFVFDQDWSEDTSIGTEALIDYNLNGKIIIKTGERWVAAKRQK